VTSNSSRSGCDRARDLVYAVVESLVLPRSPQQRTSSDSSFPYHALVVLDRAARPAELVLGRIDMSRASRIALAFSFGLIGTACGGSSGGGGDATEAFEIETLRNHLYVAGVEPLPAPPQVSDELFVLGQALFFDKVLSGNEDVSCATCHLPEFATGDGRTLSGGVQGIGLGPNRGGGVMIPRNSPALFALHLKRELFWDGRVREFRGGILVPESVELTEEMRGTFSPGLEAMAAQAMLPPVSSDEMRGFAENPLGGLGEGYPNGRPEVTTNVWQELTERLLDLPGYMQLLQAAYPDVAIQDITFAHVGNAIAAFEARAFARTDSPFERFVRGDDHALTREQRRGGLAFFGLGCAECHSGPLLSDQQFHNIGLPQIGPGVSTVFFDQFFGWDFGRENVTAARPDRFAFRTPSLLNVAITGPWGHAGQFAELRDFVAHYQDPQLSNLQYDIQSNVSDPELVRMHTDNSEAVLEVLDPLLPARGDFDVDAVVDFLEALSADDARDMSDIVPASVPSGLPIL